MLDKRARKQREALQLWERMCELQFARRNNRIKLDKPVHDGYTIRLTLREDVAKSEDAAMYRKVLRLVQKKVHSKTKKFFQWEGKGKSRKRVEIKIHPGSISSQQYSDLTDKAKALFYPEWVSGGWGNGFWRYKLRKEYMFVQKVVKHYRDYEIVHDADLESEIKQLTNRLYTTNLIKEVGRLKGWKGNSYKELGQPLFRTLRQTPLD